MGKTIALTTIGVKIGYAVGVENPKKWNSKSSTDGYTRIEGLKSTPDFNQSPNNADVTTFENDTYTSKVGLLREAPDSFEFQAVLSQGFATDWQTAVTKYETDVKAASNTTGKRMWWVIEIPGFDQAQYFTGEPQKVSFPSLEVNSAIDSFSVYVTPDGGEALIDSKPTDPTDN